VKRRVIAALASALFAAACGGSAGSSSTPAWVDQAVTFQAGGMTVYGTFRHPAGDAGAAPAALIIAGSGPTDRNGDSKEISGQVGTLKALAGWLSAAGVASLRYDKLGTGATGAGPYAANPAGVGVDVYEQEAAAALGFLSRQPGVDRSRLSVYGHSEGALYALLLATGGAGPSPPVHALGLLEPLGLRYLDLIAEQVNASVAKQEQAGQITPALAGQVRATLNAAIQSLRATGTVAANLPYGLSTLLSPATARYLSEADRIDPAQLAAALKPGTPVLLSCSDADIQVSCTDVDHLATGLDRAGAAVDRVRLAGVDHVLKEDASGTAAGYGQPLPFSSQLQSAVRAFAAR
jgi:dienelactone hydrolase